MARVAESKKIGRQPAGRKGEILLGLLLLAVLWPLPCLAAEVRLSAAASMNDAVKELVGAFCKEEAGVAVLPNFASSGSLAKQIAQGAPADLYVSANQRWMEYLFQEKKIVAQTVHVFASNALVFVGTSPTGPRTLTEIVSLPLIAMGSPKSVPAGQYAAQAMTAVGIYEHLAGQHRLVMAKDVRQALMYADRGEVDGAFVYRTDALLARHAAILFTVPAALHDQIAYAVALTPAGTKNSAAQAFFNFLKGPAAAKILSQHGFEPAMPPPWDGPER